MEDHPDVTKEAAEAEVVANDPALYAEYNAEHVRTVRGEE
jgi:hypothetical protein